MEGGTTLNYVAAQLLQNLNTAIRADGSDESRKPQVPPFQMEPTDLPSEAVPTSVDVVVVEDNDDDARMTTMALKRIDPPPSVTILFDGAEALAKLIGEKRIRPRLIVLDLKLPKVSGLEVLSAIKSSPELSDIPVMVLSSSDEPRDVSLARTLGCADYVRKPLDWMQYMHEISTAVSKLLNQNREND
jgi:CheY-like chemotaxis protein